MRDPPQVSVVRWAPDVMPRTLGIARDQVRSSRPRDTRAEAFTHGRFALRRGLHARSIRASPRPSRTVDSRFAEAFTHGRFALRQGPHAPVDSGFHRAITGQEISA